MALPDRHLPLCGNVSGPYFPFGPVEGYGYGRLMKFCTLVGRLEVLAPTCDLSAHIASLVPRVWLLNRGPIRALNPRLVSHFRTASRMHRNCVLERRLIRKCPSRRYRAARYHASGAAAESTLQSGYTALSRPRCLKADYLWLACASERASRTASARALGRGCCRAHLRTKVG